MNMLAQGQLAGVIFDLDGTLVNSYLDFDAMRSEMGILAGKPILEALEQMDGFEAARCSKILERHELNGATNANLITGVRDFLELIDGQHLQRAVVTRNSRSMAEVMLSRCSLQFNVVITREDGPVKPDPWAIHHICNLWGVESKRVVVIGDFEFDIEAGKSAGATTVFFTRGRDINQLGGASKADFVLESFVNPEKLIRELRLA